LILFIKQYHSFASLLIIPPADLEVNKEGTLWLSGKEGILNPRETPAKCCIGIIVKDRVEA
jgi:hypothetical protein